MADWSQKGQAKRPSGQTVLRETERKLKPERESECDEERKQVGGEQVAKKAKKGAHLFGGSDFSAREVEGDNRRALSASGRARHRRTVRAEWAQSSGRRTSAEH